MKAEGTTLDPLTRLRVAYWFNVLRTTSGMDVEELSKTPFWIDLGEFNFRLYASQRRRPSETTRKLLDEEFPGTLEAYESGPAGVPLWKVLAGDREACMAVLEEELQRIGEDLTQRIFFKEKVIRLWLSLLPSHLHHWKSLDELRAMENFNVIASTYAASLATYTAQSRATGKLYFQTQIMAVIAAWKLCQHFPESEVDARCRYMLEGMLEAAVPDELPEDIGPMLKAYLLGELAALA